MNGAALVVVVVAIVAVVAVVVWMFVTHTPERASTHSVEPRTTTVTDDLAGGVDRPADPNAEDQGPMTGDARPGPTGPAAGLRERPRRDR